MNKITPFMETWGEAFVALRQPQSDAATQVWMERLSYLEEMHERPPLQIMNSRSYQLISRRAEYAGLKITEQAIGALCILLTRPGTMVMWVYGLRYIQIKENIETITLRLIHTRWGGHFPEEETMHSLWDMQKGVEVNGKRYDNYLDVVDAL